jgi:cold shock CspA family protein/ribosome-associated translation inhibitor RaiA
MEPFMKVPLEISFKGIPNTTQIEELIRSKVAKLERVCGYISSCRVAVEKRQEHQSIGNPYRVRIGMTVPPGHELVVRREPSQGDMHDPLEVVLKDAFNTASRRLQKLVDLQHGQRKIHPDQQVAAIVHRLFPEQGYGFLRTVDTQEEIYFHRNSVLHNDFDRLRIGMGVRYTAEAGDKGPQATAVQVVDAAKAPVEAPARF